MKLIVDVSLEQLHKAKSNLTRVFSSLADNFYGSEERFDKHSLYPIEVTNASGKEVTVGTWRTE